MDHSRLPQSVLAFLLEELLTKLLVAGERGGDIDVFECHLRIWRHGEKVTDRDGVLSCVKMA